MNTKEKMYDGYMTVEASFIVPIAFIIFIIIIYYTFYLYNGLIVEQSCYQGALRGAQLKNASGSLVEEFAEEECRKLLDRQIYQYQISPQIEVSIAAVGVKASTHIRNRLLSMGWLSENSLVTEGEVKAVRIDPAAIIRRLH